MDNIFDRTDRLIGEESRKKLQQCHVAVFGLGGVGSYTCEALARGGIGKLTLIDGDKITGSNINRQLYALHSTVGLLKTVVAHQRINDINPDISVTEHPIFFSAENADTLDFSQFDYVVDAIDTVSSKLLIIELAKKADVPIISSMGTGNKLDPTVFTVTDIKKTSVCPLARVMRRELKIRGIDSLKVLFSTEQPKTTDGERSPASISFVPPVAGMIIAGEVIKDLIK